MLRATDGLQVELHLAGASLTQLRHKPWIFRSATMSRCLLLDETIAAGPKKKKKLCVCVKWNPGNCQCTVIRSREEEVCVVASVSVILIFFYYCKMCSGKCCLVSKVEHEGMRSVQIWEQEKSRQKSRGNMWGEEKDQEWNGRREQ